MAQLNDLVVTGKSRFLNTISGNISGSSGSCTGNAATATKLGTSTVGGTTTPIYLNGGTPTALGYTIAKSVPSNAVFTDTNTYVSQSASTTSNWRKVLLHYKDDAASSTAVTSSTNVVYAAVGVSVQPSTGTLAATKFSGDISSCTGLTKSQVTTALGYTPPTGDTNDKVTQAARNDDKIYEVLLSNSANNTTETAIVGKCTTLRFNPSKSSIMEGSNTVATGNSAHAEGGSTTAAANYAHAEGASTCANCQGSHTEGSYTTADGDFAHAEGSGTYAMGSYAHTEGRATTSLGTGCHAEGEYTYIKSGLDGCHAEGWTTTVTGDYGAHAGGAFTCANNACSRAIGHHNVAMTTGGNTSNTTGTAFVIGNGSSTTKKNAFSVQFNGVVKAASTITASTTADYAEYFEWKDENPNAEDRVGYFVTFDDKKKIRIANPNDNYILGIVSGEPFVLGNGDCDIWNGVVLRDKFNRILYEPSQKYKLDPVTRTEVPVYDDEGNPVYEGTQPIYNPDYDPTIPYIPRADRPEWAAVGMLGVLAVRDDGTCEVNDYCTVNENGIATKADENSINKYRVIQRNTEDVVEVVFR